MARHSLICPTCKQNNLKRDDIDMFYCKDCGCIFKIGISIIVEGDIK